MKKVLFVCTGNSCRSQMAEGWLKKLAPHQFTADSAGIIPSPVHPLAIKVMAEKNIDLSLHKSKPVSQFENEVFDYLITLGNHARLLCPPLPKRMERIHWDIYDPVQAEGTEEQKLKVFRNVRDEIEAKVQGLIASFIR